jgi:hypothetical protein
MWNIFSKAILNLEAETDEKRFDPRLCSLGHYLHLAPFGAETLKAGGASADEH